MTGNKLRLKRADGTIVDAHVEDVILVPDGAADLESRAEIPLETEKGSRRSPGEMMEDAGQKDTGTQKTSPSPGKLSKINLHNHVVYTVDLSLIHI